MSLSYKENNLFAPLIISVRFRIRILDQCNVVTFQENSSCKFAKAFVKLAITLRIGAGGRLDKVP